MYVLMCKREGDRLFMQWYVTKCDKAAAQDENYVFPKKYHGYKDRIRDYIGEIKRLDEFLFKGTEKLLPKKKEGKLQAKSSKSKELRRQPSTIPPKLDVQKYLGQMQKSMSKINQIPVYRLKHAMLRQLIVRSATVKQKELAAMVLELKGAKEVALVKYCHAMGIVPQEEEGKPVIEYRLGIVGGGEGTVNVVIR